MSSQKIWDNMQSHVLSFFITKEENDHKTEFNSHIVRINPLIFVGLTFTFRVMYFSAFNRFVIHLCRGGSLKK